MAREAASRKEELSEAINLSLKRNIPDGEVANVGFATFTVPRAPYGDKQMSKFLVTQAWRLMTSGRGGRDLKKLLGHDGYLRLTDIMHCEDESWHFHLHVAFFVSIPNDNDCNDKTRNRKRWAWNKRLSRGLWDIWDRKVRFVVERERGLTRQKSVKKWEGVFCDWIDLSQDRIIKRPFVGKKFGGPKKKPFHQMRGGVTMEMCGNLTAAEKYIAREFAFSTVSKKGRRKGSYGVVDLLRFCNEPGNDWMAKAYISHVELMHRAQSWRWSTKDGKSYLEWLKENVKLDDEEEGNGKPEKVIVADGNIADVNYLVHSETVVGCESVCDKTAKLLDRVDKEPGADFEAETHGKLKNVALDGDTQKSRWEIFEEQLCLAGRVSNERKQEWAYKKEAEKLDWMSRNKPPSWFEAHDIDPPEGYHSEV
jgi:hypothetical protein